MSPEFKLAFIIVVMLGALAVPAALEVLRDARRWRRFERACGGPGCGLKVLEAAEEVGGAYADMVTRAARAQEGARAAPMANRAGDGRDAAAPPDARGRRAGEFEPEPDAGLPGIPFDTRGDSREEPLLTLTRRQAGD